MGKKTQLVGIEVIGTFSHGRGRDHSKANGHSQQRRRTQIHFHAVLDVDLVN